jgi:uncharacterized protein DUF4126
MNFCTASGLSSLGTSLGLSNTTGYTPYLPVLALTVATKWFHLCQINPSFGFITSDWFLIVVAILTAVDLAVDLIPGVSSGWHTVHVVVTPFVGGFVAAATTSSNLLPGLSAQSIPFSLNGVSANISGTGSLALAAGTSQAEIASTALMFLAGFVLAGLVQLHRTGGRAIANIGHVFTLGISNVVISIVEDIMAVVGIILSFLAPVLMLIVVAIVVLFIIFTFKYVLRGLRFLRGKRGQKSTA